MNKCFQMFQVFHPVFIEAAPIFIPPSSSLHSSPTLGVSLGKGDEKGIKRVQEFK